MGLLPILLPRSQGGGGRRGRDTRHGAGRGREGTRRGRALEDKHVYVKDPATRAQDADGDATVEDKYVRVEDPTQAGGGRGEYIRDPRRPGEGQQCGGVTGDAIHFTCDSIIDIIINTPHFFGFQHRQCLLPLVVILEEPIKTDFSSCVNILWI